MSDQSSGQPPATRPPRNPFVTGLLIFIGFILLLPGLCSLIFVAIGLSQGGLFGGSIDSSIATLWLVCLTVGAGGVTLIVFAIRRH